MTAEALDVHRLPSADELEAQTEQLRRSLSRPGRRGWGEYLAASHRLYQALIAPALPTLKNKDHLIILPDRALHYVAFESLLSRPPQATARLSPARWPYLLRRWSVSYAPSATVLAQLKARSRRKTGLEFVAFADPRSSVESGVPDPKESETALSSRVGSMGALPQSAREVRRIAALFGKGASALFLGASAGEKRVKQEALVRSARYLHFAVHAKADEDHPQLSGLMLSRGTDQEDGILQVFEIVKMRLAADMVVLSACETGRGRDLRGEGLVGLTQAFLHAGVPRLVVSLWQVADDSTADLMTAMYSRLDASLSKAQALRGAKLALIEEGRYAHPFYWAPFILIGRQ